MLETVGLGDTATIRHSKLNLDLKAKIIKTTKNFITGRLEKVELGNFLPKLFASISSSIQGIQQGATQDRVDWQQAVAGTNLSVDNLSATSATIIQLNAIDATITNLTADTATIVDLEAAVGRIGILEVGSADIANLTADVVTINTLLAGNVGAANLAVGAIQAGSAVIGTGAIASAQIIDLDVSKLNAGNISTNKFTVQSDNGNLRILGDTVKLWDVSGKERVSLGLNGTDYNLLIRGTDGTTVLFGTDGVTHAGITVGAVDDTNVAIDANINGNKIDQESLVTRINGATTLLMSSHILYDPTGQTFEVAFDALSSTVTDQGTTVSNQATSISVLQGQIVLKASQTDLITTNSNLGAVTTRITNAEASINLESGQIALKASQTSLDTTNDNVTGVTSRITTAEASIVVNANGISLKASQTSLNTTNSNLANNYSTTSQMNSAITVSANAINLSISNFASSVANNYVSTVEMNSAIAVSASSINLSVSQTYATTSTVATAQAAANTAISNAATAQAAANAAQGTANSAKTYTDNLASDSVITPDEKLTLKQAWDIIALESAPITDPVPGTIMTQCLLFGLAYSPLQTYYYMLHSYLFTTLGLFTNMATATTGIDRVLWDTNWSNYYTNRTKKLNEIATKAKTLANAAQGSANTANAAITIQAGQIASKVDVNGVISTIQQNPSAVEFAFNSINSAMVTIDPYGLHVRGGSLDGVTINANKNITIGRLLPGDNNGANPRLIFRNDWAGEVGQTTIITTPVNPGNGVDSEADELDIAVNSSVAVRGRVTIFGTQLYEVDLIVTGIITADEGFKGLGRKTAYEWYGTLNPNTGTPITHNLGYYPLVKFTGTLGASVLSRNDQGPNQISVWNSGSSPWTGYVDLF